jgi:hypothetical protein
MIQVLKQPIDLNDDELAKIFDAVIDHPFDKWILDDLNINKDVHSFIHRVNIFCENTGYSVNIIGKYHIEVSSSVGYKVKLDTLKLFTCLLEIGAIKLN